jgi:hypothetical protein
MTTFLNYKFQEVDLRDIYHQTNNSITNNSITNNLITPEISDEIFSLRNNMPHILDQGQLGSCVSNAICLFLGYLDKKLIASRLYIYFNGRAISNFILEQDTGISVRNGCKSVAKYGTCSELIWPYNIQQFASLPSFTAYNSTVKLNNFSYLAVYQTLTSIIHCLTENYPILFGFLVYESFFSPIVTSTGIVSMPNTTTETLQGGHCCVIVGYDSTKKLFICANSWGTSWGDKGYFYLPYNYILSPQLAGDFWTLRISNTITNTTTNNKTNNKLFLLRKIKHY